MFTKINQNAKTDVNIKMKKEIEKLNDQELLLRTTELARKERQIILDVLHHLKEIELRRLFSTLVCPSLFTYCTEKLGYSEGSAQRRIQAMRALRDMPEVESKIEAGEITLSNLAMAQSLFSQKRRAGAAYSVAEKLSVVAQLEGKSTREAERVISVEAPTFGINDRVRALTENQNELKIIVDDQFLRLLELFKGRLAHKMPAAKTGELLKFALELGLQQLDKSLPKKNRSTSAEMSTLPPAPAVIAADERDDGEHRPRPSALQKVFVPPTLAVKQKWRSTFEGASSIADTESKPGRKPPSNATSRAISNLIPRAAPGEKTCAKLSAAPSEDPRAIPDLDLHVNPRSVSANSRREVWRMAESKCENCASRYALEVDHRNPRALGGGHGPENLRLLCRSCNQRAAIERFGLKKIGPNLAIGRG